MPETGPDPIIDVIVGINVRFLGADSLGNTRRESSGVGYPDVGGIGKSGASCARPSGAR
jgi:hypothetical protein